MQTKSAKLSAFMNDPYFRVAGHTLDSLHVWRSFKTRVVMPTGLGLLITMKNVHQTTSPHITYKNTII